MPTPIVIKHLSDILHYARKVEHAFLLNPEDSLTLDTVVYLEGVTEPFTARMECSGGLSNRTFAMSRNVAAVLEEIEALVDTNQLTHLGAREIRLEYGEEA